MLLSENKDRKHILKNIDVVIFLENNWKQNFKY